MEPTQTSAQPAPADAAPQADVTSGAGNAAPVVDESATKTVAVAAVTETAAAAAPADAAPKAGEPPAQAGDEGETHVAEAKPVLLPSVADARKELAANPARVSVMSSEGLVVREG